MTYSKVMFDHCLYFNTTSLARKLEREWSLAFKPFGLTPAQAFMLRVICHQPKSLQSEVASSMNVSRSTATRTLDGLEKLGLISRQASSRDGREAEIHPTTAALDMVDAINKASGEVTRRLKKTLGPEVFEQVVSEVRLVSEQI